MTSRIPFNVPYISGNEKKYINQVFENGHFAGNGPFTVRVQKWLENYLGGPKVLLTHSCTAGLEISAILSNLGPGDEVLLPSFTFVTTASSIMRCGAKPVFCEINPESMLIDLDDAAARITPQTKAIVVVHYAGISPNMDEVISFANQNGLVLIEDAAQGLGSSWKGKSLGTFAPFGAISFHETKNIHCGLGGCLVVNDKEYFERAEIVWERGTDRGAFFKGFVDKYSWKEVGSSFYPSEIQAAFLLAQLESMDENLGYRKKIWGIYESELRSLESEGLLSIIRPGKYSDDNGHMLAILLPTAERADIVRTGLNDIGIQTVIHYVPLHTSTVGQELGYSNLDLEITTSSAERLLRLPLHHEMDEESCKLVVSSMEKILLD